MKRMRLTGRSNSFDAVLGRLGGDDVRVVGHALLRVVHRDHDRNLHFRNKLSHISNVEELMESYETH
jgi:hypothetical protein